MDSNLLFYGFTTIFYLFCAVKILFNVKKKSDETPFWVLGVTALGVIAHFWVLQSGIFVASHTLALGMGSIISAICFISVLVLLFGSIYGQGSSLLALVLMVAAFGVCSRKQCTMEACRQHLLYLVLVFLTSVL